MLNEFEDSNLVNETTNEIEECPQNIDHEPTWLIYPLENYGIRVDDNLSENLMEDSIANMNGFNKKVDSFLRDGIGRSVAALILTHRYLCPHVVLLQSDLTSEWMLPNCLYRAWENPRTVLVSFLKSLFFTDSNSTENNTAEVGEYLGSWWRTEFNYSPLPYLPPHSTRPKELIRIYQVLLPPKVLFKLPKYHVLKSLPLFDLDPNIFGIACGGIPQLISRFQIQPMVQSDS
ncbi:hypothetical protein ACR3K2_15150 [Cryptosporidium serpentis]